MFKLILNLIKVQVIMFGDICKKKYNKIIENSWKCVWKGNIKITQKNCQVSKTPRYASMFIKYKCSLKIYVSRMMR